MSEGLSPKEVYELATDEAGLVVLTFYRGRWCPICKKWLKEWHDVINFASQLKKYRGVFIMVSSEPQESVDRFAAAVGVDTKESDFHAIGDPGNEIASALRAKGLLNVAITGAPGPYKTHGTTYPHGMTQPAVLVLAKNPDSVLYSWACAPKLLNLGGAVHRPMPVHIWQYVMHVIQPSVVSTIGLPRSKTWRYMCPRFGHKGRAFVIE